MPESLELEFKRQLDLKTDNQKTEAAKDISAMANTIGGRIIYGIEEVKKENGIKVAGPLRPLTDGLVIESLASVAPAGGA